MRPEMRLEGVPLRPVRDLPEGDRALRLVRLRSVCGRRVLPSAGVNCLAIVRLDLAHAEPRIFVQSLAVSGN